MKKMHVKNVKIESKLSVTEGKYYLEYFHSIKSSDKVISSNGHLNTCSSKMTGSQIYIKRHSDEGGMNYYETLQDVASGKWIKATKNGNTFVKSEMQATWFQVLGVGSYYVIQYVDPLDVKSSNQLGVDNGPIGSELKLLNSQTELFKLTPA